jgi:nitrate reductase gamma subunit
MSGDTLFSVCPYVAAALFAAGLAVRYLWARRRTPAASLPGHVTGPPWGGLLWRAGLAMLVVGHLAGLLFPDGILAWNVSPARLYLLEGAALASGVAALAGWSGLCWGHLRRGSGSRAAVLADTAFLSLLGVALASGLAMAVLHRWASSWGAMILTPYARSLLGGRPAAELATELPYLARLHVAVTFALLAVAPWTRLGTLVATALARWREAAGRRLAPVGVAALARLRKRDPRPWIWPEED